MSQFIELNGIIADAQFGLRLDQALAELFPDYSRSRIKDWILAGQVYLEEAVITLPREKVLPGQRIRISAPVIEDTRFLPENLPLNVVFEDEHILIIDKPAGLIVHPGAGAPDGTLLNALLHHYPSIAEVPRAGIVHRLDKDTTGLMIVAKTLPAQTHLVADIQARQVTREYEAIACGHMTAGGEVDAPIGRHPTQRTHMAIVPGGRASVTHYRIHEKFRAHTRLRLRLETGRTHQIRVHMAHIKHPLVGDPAYGGRSRPLRHALPELAEYLRHFKRQALHATSLQLLHPITGEALAFNSPTPEDMEQLLTLLRADTAANPDELIWK